MEREEAIRRIKARFDRWALDDEDMKAIQTLAPELTMSEDERMIYELQGFLSSFGSDYFGTGEWQKFDNWLEKQKEQKPVDFPTTDEEVNEFLKTHPKVEVPEKYKTPDFVFSKQEYESHPIISKDTTSVKPAEWSEEDADMLNCCISSIEEAKENRYAYKETDGDTSYDREIDWLKSLRPQPHTVSIKDATKFSDLEYERGVKDGIQSEKSHQWKPSEEQMKALEKVRHSFHTKELWAEINPVVYAYESLMRDLQKLL